MSLIESIDALCLKRIGRKPDLENPTTYNDKIQWLKVHDQTELHKQACDKLQVRDLVSEVFGPRILIPLLYEGSAIQRVSKPHMLKANHDSGSAFVVRNDHDFAGLTAS